MKIQDIYDRYDIMPNLREHQLRVAAVALYICKQLPEPLAQHEDLIIACLLHDMGNIIKADLSHFPEFITPDILPHFLEVKRKMMEKYPDEHTATLEIARELGANEHVLLFLENARLIKYDDSIPELEPKIYNYADMRVAPHGVRLLDERLADLRARYDTPERREKYSEIAREAFEKRMHEFEKDIFTLLPDVNPGDITDESVAPLMLELETMDIALAS